MKKIDFLKQGMTSLALVLGLVFSAFTVANAQFGVTISTTSSCGGNTGSATANPFNGWPEYMYQWSNGATTQTISGLSPGTYSVTVIDKDQAIATASTTIGGGILSVEMNASFATCDIATDGTAAVAAVPGGVEPISYQWSDGQTFVVAYNLTPGFYSVTVTDANGCTGVGNVEVEKGPESIWLMPTSEASTCGCNGTADPHAMLGIPPYTYMWSDGQTTAVATGLCPGDYGVTVTDTQGCMGEAVVSVGGTDTPLTVSVSTTDEECGDDSGTATANATGGTGNYTYAWNNGANTQMIGGLSAGTYSVTVTDDQGCSGEASGVVNGTEAPEAGVASTNDPTTICIDDGIPDPITVDITGANSESFLWILTDPAGNIVATPPGPTFDLEGGVVGNCNIYYLAYNGPISGVSFPNNISDIEGCFDLSNPITLDRNDADPATISTTDNVNICVGDGNNDFVNVTINDAGLGDGAWVITAADGEILGLPAAPPFNFEGAGTGICSIWYLTNDGGVTGLEMGNNIADVAGCFALSNAIVVTRYQQIEVELIETPISACLANDGALSAAVSFGSGSFAYAWSNGGTGSSISNLAEGEYCVTVTDLIAGCETEACMFVADPGLFIGDYVWYDNNENCRQDPYESGVAFVPVDLYEVGVDGIACTDDDKLVASTGTDVDGFYLFECIDPGTYYIEFHALALLPDYKYTCKDGASDMMDSDANENGKTDAFTVNEGDGRNLTYDAGVTQICNDVNFAGEICCDQEICAGELPETIEEVRAAGGGGVQPLEYLWMFTTDIQVIGNTNDSSWQPIPGATDKDYTPGPLYKTTYFVRCVRRKGCDTYNKESNVIQIKVLACSGAPNTASITLDNGQGFSIYPNPAQDALNIQNFNTLSSDAVLEILTISGQVMHQQVLGEGTSIDANINVRELPAGTYFVRITQSDDAVEMMKFVKL